MDREERGIVKMINFFRMSIFILWVLFSTVVYGTICIITSVFSRKIAKKFEWLWAKNLLWFGGVKLVITGTEKCARDKRYVFAVNHQSALDIPVMVAALTQQACFIAKKELFYVPFLGWGVAAVGHVYVDRKNAKSAIESIKRAVNRLKKDNSSLLIFPEGTRSSDGRIGKFKQGSFSLALQAGVPVVPVAIRNSSVLLPKSSMRIKPGKIYIDICDPIEITPEMTKGDLCVMVQDVVQKVVEKEIPSVK
jgi:1-acyl-sn-glycerol-3-phosphate acyltransferase